MSINPKYKRTKQTLSRIPYQKHEFLLDASDTIFFANYFLGYFAHSRFASELMRLQKIEDLKKRKLFVGYSFDYVLHNVDVKAATSHELVLRYDLPTPQLKKPIRTPRFIY